MPTELIDLELDEVSLVMAGDDPLAKVAIVKCRDQQEEKEVTKMTEEMKAKLKPYMDKGMSEEEAKKAYEEDQEKELSKFKAENQLLRKALIENGFVIKADSVEKKNPEPVEEEMIEVEGEQVAKSSIPAPVLKALEAAEFAKRDAEITKKAQENLPNFDEAVAKSFMEIQLTDEQMSVLKAADKLFGKMTEEIGDASTESDMNTAEAKLDSMVEKIATEKNINKTAAFDEVAKTKEGKALINEVYYKKED